MTCDQCAYQGDDGMCYCEDPATCPRGMIEDDKEEEECQE